MTSKKSSFFAGLFSRKKSANKENVVPHEDSQDTFYRTQSVRGSRRHRQSRFENERFSPEYPNPYHGNVKPRLHPKGPQSCPEGYRDEPIRYDESFEENRSAVHHHRGQSRHEKFRRSNRDTSEYGSGDPSPIANMGRHSQHPHYNTSLIDDSEPEEFYKYGRESDLLKDLSYLRDKLTQTESRKNQYKAQCKKLKEEKGEIEKAFTDRVKSLKEENSRLREENAMLKSEKALHNNQHHQQPSHFSFQPSHFSMNNYPSMSHMQSMTYGNGPYSQPYTSHQYNPRHSINPSHNVLTSITPGTSSTMESSAGAGEALAQPGDMSFPCNRPNFDSSFSHQEDEEDTKDFSNRVEEEAFESVRADLSSSSLGIQRRDDSIHLVRDSNASHASSGTMIASPTPIPPEKSRSSSSVRRTASESILN